MKGVFMEVKDFAEKLISHKNKEITDEIFLLIQNNKEFMQDYLELVQKNGLKAVNQQIGKIIKNVYKLDNDVRQYEPKSTLITSHQEFK
jgi:hypothetical protein